MARTHAKLCAAACRFRDAYLGELTPGQRVVLQRHRRESKDPATWSLENDPQAQWNVNALPSYALSVAELEQLNRTGFVVAPSLVPRRDFGSALYGIYASDLPVFFSADAALHAFHVTFETGVAALEEHRLKPMLHQLLSNMTSRLQDLAYVCDTKCGVLPPWVIASRVCSCAGGCSLGFVSRLYPSTGCCFTYGSARTTCPRTSSCASHPGCGCVLDCCSLFDGG